MTVAIRIENLHRQFLDGSGNKLTVLTGINAQFRDAQTVSVVGSSGSGKSTLLHILGGLDHPTLGQIYYRDKPIFSFDSDKLADWRNRCVGFVFQSHHLMPDFTALENVMLPGMIKGLTKPTCLERATELLEQVGLQDRLTHKPTRLSGGEQQRVAIARALVNSPDIILADEPTGNLDTRTGEMVGDLLGKVCHDQKATLVLVTHNTKLAAEMDYRLKLENGVLSTA